MPRPLVAPAPLWRREPYRVLFPEALALAWAGVLYWLLFAAGAVGAWRPEYHAATQIEGFVACIAVGFLYTFVPRRAGGAPVSPAAVGVAVVAPAVTTVASALGSAAVAQGAFLALVATVLAFALRRLLAPGGTLRLPNAIVWVPAGLVLGGAGAALVGWGAGRASDVGLGLLSQAMITAFVAGIGATLLPVLTRGEPHAETAGTRRDAWLKAVHALGAALLTASFALELASVRAGYALRAAVVLVALVAGARIQRPPTVPGLHRWLVWISAWLLPIGFAIPALAPRWIEAGLHVVFVGGFATMALSVGYHVAVAHGGRPELLGGRPWPIAGMGVLLGAAVVLRALFDLAPAHAAAWLGAAAAAFLAATVCWGIVVVPRLRGP